MNRVSGILFAIAAAVIVGLVWMAVTDLVLMILAVAMAVGLLLIVYPGPDRLGFGMLALAMFLAPQNDIRPSEQSHQLLWCDIAFAMAFALLLPRLLQHRTRTPVLFAAGAVGVLVMSIASSVVAESPGLSMWWGFHLIATGIILPLLFCFLGPSTRQVSALAAAFVCGQVMSTLVALAEGVDIQGRYNGTTYHPNYLGLGGLFAVALIPFLFHQTKDRRLQALLVGAGLLCAWSISLSGSRGALVAIIALALLYPLIERSTLSAYLLVSATLLVVPAVGLIVDAVSPGSALGRFLGKEETASASDDLRRERLGEGWDRLMQSPIWGSGFEENLEIHNIFLQVAVAIGVLGLAAWLVMIASAVLPLFSDSKHRLLGYVGLAYLGIGLTEPALWDRVVWAPLSLAILAGVTLAPDRQSRLHDQLKSRA